MMLGEGLIVQNYTLDMLFNKRMREEGYKFDNPFFGKVIIEQFLESIIEDTELRRAISEGRDSRVLISKLVPPVKEDIYDYFLGERETAEWVSEVPLLHDKDFINGLTEESKLELAKATFKVFEKYYLKQTRGLPHNRYIEDSKKEEYRFNDYTFSLDTIKLNKELKQIEDLENKNSNVKIEPKSRREEEERIREEYRQTGFSMYKPKETGLTTAKELPRGVLLGELGDGYKPKEKYGQLIGQFKVKDNTAFRYELGLYGTDLDKPVNYKRVVAMYMPAIIITVLGMIGFLIGTGTVGLVQPILLLLFGVSMGSHMLITKNKHMKLTDKIEDLKLKYTINQDFRFLNEYDESFKYTTDFLKDSRINGVRKVVNFFNKPYQLEDGMPVRLYQLMYLDEGKVRITHNVTALPEEELYKEMLLPEPLTEDDFIKLYTNLKEEAKYEKEVKHYKQTLLSAKEDDEKYKKALEYSKEYHRLYENKKDTLGMNASKKKWEDVSKSGVEEWKQLAQKNAEIIKQHEDNKN